MLLSPLKWMEKSSLDASDRIGALLKIAGTTGAGAVCPVTSGCQSRESLFFLFSSILQTLLSLNPASAESESQDSKQCIASWKSFTFFLLFLQWEDHPGKCICFGPWFLFTLPLNSFSFQPKRRRPFKSWLGLLFSNFFAFSFFSGSHSSCFRFFTSLLA